MERVYEVKEYISRYEVGKPIYYGDSEYGSIHAKVCESVLDYFYKKAIEHRLNKLNAEDYTFDVDEHYIVVPDEDGIHATRYDYIGIICGYCN